MTVACAAQASLEPFTASWCPGGFAGSRRQGRLLAATDAGYHPRTRIGGLGFVVNDGQWGLKPYVNVKAKTAPIVDPSGPSLVAVLELRAVELLLATTGIKEATVLIDNAYALRLLDRWHAGHIAEMPEGYNLRRRSMHPSGLPTLVRLATEVAARPDLEFAKVAGHTGHPLNEVADALAKLARRRQEGDEVDVKERAEGLVRAFLRQAASQVDRPS